MRTTAWWLGGFVGLALALPAVSVGDEPAEKDYTAVPLADLDLEPVAPTKDAKTAFVVGGKNDSKQIRALATINGRPIAALEKDMRPGGLSRAGFLGKDEKPLDVLAKDNDYVVGELGLTHQALAEPLRVAGAVGRKHFPEPPGGTTFRYRGGRFRVKLACFRGYQESPFEDETKANCNAVVENLATGAKVSYSLLVPEMVARYGFYEGAGTPYRVDPRQVVAVFDFLTAKAK